MKWALLASLLWTSSAIAAGDADAHLLAGARSFKQGQFPEALVEFRVAERLGSKTGLWYAGASLVKLHRPEEALEAFAAALAADPAGRDALLDYYRALACYDARLYLCADGLLASVGDRSGPRIEGQVRETRAQIARALRAGPTTVAIDWYHQRASVTASEGRRALAIACFEEALALSALRDDRYRTAEAAAGLARLRPERTP